MHNKRFARKSTYPLAYTQSKPLTDQRMKREVGRYNKYSQNETALEEDSHACEEEKKRISENMEAWSTISLQPSGKEGIPD